MDILSILFTSTPTQVIPVWLDLLSVVIGAMSGCLVGCNKKLDLVGVIACGILTGLGGGLIRDTVMQAGDVYFLTSNYAIASALITSLIVFFFHTLLERIPHIVEWVDILSVALFVICGTDKALMYNLSSLAVVFMGTMTGVGGGMLRDVFIGETPRIFKKSNLYALCAVAGSISFLIARRYQGLTSGIAVIICIITTVGLRRLSLRYNIQSPAEVDLASRLFKLNK